MNVRIILNTDFRDHAVLMPYILPTLRGSVLSALVHMYMAGRKDGMIDTWDGLLTNGTESIDVGRP